jgi:hypothetical protein
VVKLENAKGIVEIAARRVIPDGCKAENAPEIIVISQRDVPVRLVGQRF